MNCGPMWQSSCPPLDAKYQTSGAHPPTASETRTSSRWVMRSAFPSCIAKISAGVMSAAPAPTVRQVVSLATIASIGWQQLGNHMCADEDVAWVWAASLVASLVWSD